MGVFSLFAIVLLWRKLVVFRIMLLGSLVLSFAHALSKLCYNQCSYHIETSLLIFSENQ